MSNAMVFNDGIICQ